jgi:sn-glycerol 3-phosphate transport system ATP-binding protein
MATVDIKGVSKFYDNQCILDDIHLNVAKGEFVVIVGPSGCGKSTLLRLIAGLDELKQGHIFINQQCVNKIPAAERDMAMVFQQYALYPHMSVYDNMAYSLKIRKMNKKDIRQRIDAVASMLQLQDYLHRKPSQLSGGQRQRVAMGRAMVRSPAVFLFDEPLSNLDAKLRTEMRHEIKKIHQKLQATCLYVTHDQTEAMTLADRIVVLNKGRIEQIGTPKELYENPSSLFVAGFIGHYPMNFIKATINLSEKCVRLNTGTLLALPPIRHPEHAREMTRFARYDVDFQQSVILGIRPEHIYLTQDQNGLAVQVEFVEDMGMDKLVHVKTLCEQAKFLVRVPGEYALEDRFTIQMDMEKAHLFSA